VGDAFSTAAGSASAGNVLLNDSVGSTQASSANVTLLQTAGQPGIVIAGDGTVSVLAGVASGTYPASYQICQRAAPTSCATASVSVTVLAARLINAADDSFSATPGSANAGNVFNNDTLGGAALDDTTVVLVQQSGTPAIVIAGNGTVSIAAGTALGSQTATYQICEIADAGNCDTATVTVLVAATITVVANGDAFTATSGSANAGNVLTNDAINGDTPSAGTVLLTQPSGAPALLIASDGTVSIAVGTPAGTYTASYQICALASPASCASATVSVIVTSSGTTVAVNDAFSSIAGNANVGNVLSNDNVDGASADASNVLLTQLSGAPQVLIASSGVVSIIAGTPVGPYTASYRICALAAPTDCATASVAIIVTATAPVISAVADSFSAASGSASAGNVLLNDTVNGAQASTSTVLLSQTGGAPQLLIAEDGTVSIVAGTAPGPYTASYQICAVGNATACSSASVSVVVTPAPALVLAVNDSIATTPGTANAGNVLGNDSVDGVAATPASVGLTQLSGGPQILIASSGVVSVIAGTAEGSYTATYQICQLGNAGNCASASVTVLVTATAPAIDAVNDVFVGAAGTTSIGRRRHRHQHAGVGDPAQRHAGDHHLQHGHRGRGDRYRGRHLCRALSDLPEHGADDLRRSRRRGHRAGGRGGGQRQLQQCARQPECGQRAGQRHGGWQCPVAGQQHADPDRRRSGHHHWPRRRGQRCW
jgi:hypothetical protein